MVSFAGPWSRTEAETFLDAAVVPIRLACRTPAGGLWMLSLWYRYRDGRFECATSADARIVRFLRADSEVCFEVSTNRPPYMGVRGAGEARLVEEGAKDVLGDLIDRYLGTTDGEMAGWLLREEREEVAIEIEPTRLSTWDFTPRMREATEGAPPPRSAEPSSPKYD